jgi:hypothetical protein
MQFQMLREFAAIQDWASCARILGDEEIKQTVKMPIMRFWLRCADAAPYG